MKFLLTFVVICIVGTCRAQINPAVFAAKEGAEQIDADKTKWTPFQCREGILGPNDDRMKDVGACAQTHGLEPGQQNPSCTYFCQAVALGLLNNQGVPTQAIYNAWVKESIPQRHQSLTTAWFRDCFEKYGKYIDLNDQDCKMAKLFGDCTWDVQPNLTCPKA